MPTWNIDIVDGPRIFANMTDRTFAYRSNGQPCAAYGGDGLYFACYNSTTAIWETMLLDYSVGVGQYASLAFFFSPLTTKEEAFIAYYDATNGALKLMYTFGGLWQAPVNVPTPAPLYLRPEAGGGQATAETAPEGDIDFLAEVRKLQLPWLNNVNPNNPDFIIQNPPGVGKYTSIAADSNGIYISYYDDRVKPGGTTMKSERNLKFARWKGGANWYFMVVDNYLDQGAVGLWSSLKVDSNSNVHIAYFDEKYDDLKYAFWDQKDDDMDGDGDDWWTATVDGEGGDQARPNTGSMCSLDLFDQGVSGVRGVPYISYLDFTDGDEGAPDGDLRLSRLTGWGGENGSWNRQTINFFGHHGLVVVDRGGKRQRPSKGAHQLLQAGGRSLKVRGREKYGRDHHDDQIEPWEFRPVHLDRPELRRFWHAAGDPALQCAAGADGVHLQENDEQLGGFPDRGHQRAGYGL